MFVLFFSFRTQLSIRSNINLSEMTKLTHTSGLTRKHSMSKLHSIMKTFRIIRWVYRYLYFSKVVFYYHFTLVATLNNNPRYIALLKSVIMVSHVKMNTNKTFCIEFLHVKILHLLTVIVACWTFTGSKQWMWSRLRGGQCV